MCKQRRDLLRFAIRSMRQAREALARGDEGTAFARVLASMWWRHNARTFCAPRPRRV